LAYASPVGYHPQNNIAPRLFFPPLLLAAAALPPLWAISWFIDPAGAGINLATGLGALRVEQR